MSCEHLHITIYREHGKAFCDDCGEPWFAKATPIDPYDNDPLPEGGGTSFFAQTGPVRAFQHIDGPPPADRRDK